MLTKRLIAALLLYAVAATPSWAFTPDLIAGCKVVAEERKSASIGDSVHAAYCLGVIDGIMASVLKQQSGIPLPDPCFDQQFIKPNVLAHQVVVVLSERPKIIEMARQSANDRGAIAAYFALAITNQCNRTEKNSK